MDPFEEFEFKPLTEGLGFHNNQPKATPVAQAPAAQAAASTKLNELNFADLDFVAPEARVQIQNPLPRARDTNSESSIQARKEMHDDTSAKVDEILRTLGERKKFDFTETRPQAAAVATWSESRPELSATLLDGMLIFASYLASLIILLMVTKIDLFANLVYPDSDRAVFIGLGVLLGGISWIYLVANRIFMGYTPGEWVFDQRLGRPEALGTSNYSLLVAARSLLVVASGFVLLPLASWILQRDVVGKALGLPLMRKV
jgi:hypothetical protein